MKNKKKNPRWGVIVPIIIILLALGWMFRLHEKVFEMSRELSPEAPMVLEQEYPLWSSVYDQEK
ncbi:hypothetical protein K9M41_00260 [Candidatus Gracilibacteria bacterium]|nr:hypothetical protein [Candidatus Gracilibacteria bacterium]